MIFASIILAKLELTVVIPAYNEENRISRTLRAIHDYFSGRHHEIIVVDDGSTDGTIASVHALGIPTVRVISYSGNRGKGYAVREGMLASKGRYVLLSDADLSTPIHCFDDLWAHHGDHEVVVGSRGLQSSQVNNHWYRVFLGKMGNKLIQTVVPGIVDTQCGFKLFEGEAARHIFRQQRLEGFGFDFEVLSIAQHMGLSLKEVPVRWVNAEGSKVRPHHYFSTLRELGQVWLNHRKGVYQYGLTRSELYQ